MLATIIIVSSVLYFYGAGFVYHYMYEKTGMDDMQSFVCAVFAPIALPVIFGAMAAKKLIIFGAMTAEKLDTSRSKDC